MSQNEKHRKHGKMKNYFSKGNCRKYRPTWTRIKQNNDLTIIMRKKRFRSSYKLDVRYVLWKSYSEKFHNICRHGPASLLKIWQVFPCLLFRNLSGTLSMEQLYTAAFAIPWNYISNEILFCTRFSPTFSTIFSTIFANIKG